MCPSMVMVTSVHSIRKSIKSRNSKTRWKVPQKIQDCTEAAIQRCSVEKVF